MDCIKHMHVFRKSNRVFVKRFDLIWDLHSHKKASVVKIHPEELDLRVVCICEPKPRVAKTGPGKGRGRARGRGASTGRALTANNLSGNLSGKFAGLQKTDSISHVLLDHQLLNRVGSPNLSPMEWMGRQSTVHATFGHYEIFQKPNRSI